MTRFLSICVCLLALAGTGSAQTEMIPAGGSELFRFLLHQKGLKPAEVSLNYFDPAVARETIVVVKNAFATNNGNLSWVNSANSLRKFVEAGGAVLYVSGMTYQNELTSAWEAQWGMRITLEPVTVNPGDSPFGDPEIVWLMPRPRLPRLAADSPHLMMRDLEQPVIARNPRYLTRLPGKAALNGFEVVELAGFPRSASAAGQSVAGECSMISFRHVASRGQLIFIPDEEVVSNGLMLQGVKLNQGEKPFEVVTGNLPMSQKMIDWLKGTGRTQCLFVENGQIVPQFAREVVIPPTPTPPIPNIPPEVLANILLNNASPIITELQDQDFFNRTLLSFVSKGNILRALGVILFGAFILYAWSKRSAFVPRKPDTSSLAAVERFEGQLPHGRILRQRNVGQFEVENLYESARRRARDRLIPMGGEPDAEGRMPPLLLADDCKQPQVLMRTIQRLWRIAFATDPIAVSPGSWDSFNQDLEQVLAEARRGGWSFARAVS
jgi:hypothetical protein